MGCVGSLNISFFVLTQPCLLPIRLCGLLDLGQGCPCPAWHHWSHETDQPGPLFSPNIGMPHNTFVTFAFLSNVLWNCEIVPVSNWALFVGNPPSGLHFCWIKSVRTSGSHTGGWGIRAAFGLSKLKMFDLKFGMNWYYILYTYRCELLALFFEEYEYMI